MATANYSSIFEIRQLRPGTFWYWSVGGHLVLLLVVLFFSWPKTSPTVLTERLLATSVRVDLVAMPKLTIKELQNLEIDLSSVSKTEELNSAKTQLPPVDEVKDEDAYQLAQKKSRQKFQEMLQTAAKKAQGKMKNQSASRRKAQEQLAALAVAGNKLAQGNALTGDSTAEAASALNTYAGQVRDLVRPYWRLPSYLQEQNLRCVVHVFISAQGKLLKAQIVESSNNAEFDRWALQAAENAPYPEPPEAAQNTIVRYGLKLVFPL